MSRPERPMVRDKQVKNPEDTIYTRKLKHVLQRKKRKKRRKS